jgi:hypothetical protein
MEFRSHIIAMLIPEGNPGATLLMRRGDGQFAFARIDARVATAARLAARLNRKGARGADERDLDECFGMV